MKAKQTPAQVRLRTQVRLILAITVVFGAMVSWTMLKLGFESVFWRNLMVLPLCYLFFLVVVRLWRFPFDHSMVSVKQNAASRARDEQVERDIGWSDLVPGYFDFGYIMIAAALVLVLFGITSRIVNETMSVLLDGLLEAGLGAGLLNILGRKSRSVSLSHLFSKTLFAFFCIYLLSLGMLLMAQKSCPQQTTLAGIVLKCWVTRSLSP